MKLKIRYKILLLIAFISSSYKANCQVNEINFSHQNFNASASPRTMLNPMSIKMWDNYGNGGPTTYSTILEIYGLVGHQTSQLSFGGWDNSKIKYREAFYAQNLWSDWISLLDSKNDVESSGLLKIAGNGNHYLLQGKFGIGTSNPTAPLTVFGESNFYPRMVGAQDSRSLAVRTTLANNSFVSNNYPLVLGTGGGDQPIILDAARIGIGTSNPDEKLTVKGKIHAEEVKVDLTVPGPDYVFKEDYKLTPLSEIQSYIKTNKHLPEIPSAKQMEADGINLSEMNMLLLKKVEELTLHLIEKDKKIKIMEDSNLEILNTINSIKLQLKEIKENLKTK